METGAVLFDLDGTLVDSLPDLVAALNRLLAEQDLRAITIDEAVTMVGDGAGALVARALSHLQSPVEEAELTEEWLPRFLAHYDQGLTVETKLYPGALETLVQLERGGWRQGLCTNKPEAPSREILQAYGLLPFLPVVIGGDTLAERKPSAMPVLTAIERLGASPGRSVMVGDSKNDVLSAHAAGIPAIAVSFGYSLAPAKELGADVVIDHLSQLPDAVEALLQS